MFKIPKIENANFYLDLSIKAMQEHALKEREQIEKRFKTLKESKSKPEDEIKLDKRKDLELEKIRYLNESIHRKLRKIILSFPKFLKVEDIYKQLINTSETKIEDIERAIEKINWVINNVDNLTQTNQYKIKKTRNQKTINFIMQKHLGKVNSYFKKNKESFEILDKARKFMNKLPTFKDLFTCAIAGFPNVGKSTLMKQISGSDVEIQNYPFTTKGLMFGYLEDNGKKVIQLIDTPGLLGRDKNNQIEERAQIVIRYYSEIIIFVLDFTESCGFSSDLQMKLLKKISNEKKEIILYFSKTDLYDEEVEYRKNEFKNRLRTYKQFSNFDDLRKYLIEEKNKKVPKFDPTKIKLIK